METVGEIREIYQVLVLRDAKTGVTTFEKWVLDGKFHRAGGKPAIIRTDPVTGVAVEEEFWLDDQEHNLSGPSFIKRTPQGTVVCEQWKQNGVVTREGDKPAYWERNPETMVRTLEEYSLNGNLHREGGPAIVERDASTGKVTAMRFFSNGVEVAQSDLPIDFQP